MKNRVMTLPIGTNFHVDNGLWNGRIIEENGVRYLLVLETGSKIKLPNRDVTEDLEIITEEEQIKREEEWRKEWEKTGYL